MEIDEAGKYVAGAYGVFVLLVVIYATIIGAKIARIGRETSELKDVKRPQR